MLYKEAGLGLDDIKTLLNSETSQCKAILEQQLLQINDEIAGLRAQQKKYN